VIRDRIQGQKRADSAFQHPREKPVAFRGKDVRGLARFEGLCKYLHGAIMPAPDSPSTQVLFLKCGAVAMGS
jgi:hypothetical protein